ncbi:MAG TPA: glucosamine-6-phosphate deaminase [Nocardioides sp.]|jgi:glucosamine-6-phosphate deaminase|nr:glucosamine-6-phosphate deaminase [Nocardioides sp.]
MEVVITATAQEAGQVAARPVLDALAGDPALVLGVATGESPRPIYRALAQAHAAGTDFSRMRCFALDEYVGLPADHPASYHAVIRRELVEPLGLDTAEVHVPDGMADDLLAVCATYEAAIRAAGGIAVQLLGIGADGHIGFNEPTSSLASRTRIKTLTARTRRDNAQFFGDSAVPTQCVTQGLGTILEARHLVLVAFGERKAEGVAAAVEGPVSARCPASVIQLHPHVTVILDEAAAAELELSEYYRSTYATKPSWQQL